MAFAAKDSKPGRYGGVGTEAEFFDRRMSEQRYAAMNFSDGATKKRFLWGAEAMGGAGPKGRSQNQSSGAGHVL